MNEPRHDMARFCVKELRNLVNTFVLICEKIANGDCSFLACWKVDSVLWDDVLPLGQTEPLRRVKVGFEHS